MGQGTQPQKDQTLWSYLRPPPHKLEDLPKLVNTSSQVSILDDVKMQKPH